MKCTQYKISMTHMYYIDDRLLLASNTQHTHSHTLKGKKHQIDTVRLNAKQINQMVQLQLDFISVVFFSFSRQVEDNFIFASIDMAHKLVINTELCNGEEIIANNSFHGNECCDHVLFHFFTFLISIARLNYKQTSVYNS